MTAVLGIDLGLSGVRADVVDRDGRVLGSGRVPVAPRWADGVAEADPTAWVRGVADAADRAVESAGTAVEAVGVAALGAAPVLTGPDGPLGPVALFGLDRRADPWRAALGTGPDHALPTLLRIQEETPAMVAAAETVLDPAGTIVAWLSGERAMDRITATSYRWPGVEAPVAMPPVVEPTAVVGRVREAPARATGVAAGTPVAAGTIDCFADLAAAGVRAAGDAGIVLGSTLIVYAVADEDAAGLDEARSLGLDVTEHVGPGRMVGGSTATGGLAIDWLAGVLDPSDDTARRADALEPGAGGLLALPYLAGERTPLNDPNARGILSGLTLRTRGEHLLRAIIDGVALTGRDIASRIGTCGITPSACRVTGGGVGNPMWLRAMCDAVGTTFEVMPNAGHAMGAAWIAFASLGDEPRWEPDNTIEPDPGRTARYGGLLARQRELWELAAPVARGPGEGPSDVG